jgi:hypothetical protein
VVETQKQPCENESWNVHEQSLGKIREKTNTTKCVGNLRQIGVFVGIYLAENNGYLPYWLPTTNGGSWVWDNYAYTATRGGELPRLAGYHPQLIEK